MNVQTSFLRLATHGARAIVLTIDRHTRSTFPVPLPPKGRLPMPWKVQLSGPAFGPYRCTVQPHATLRDVTEKQIEVSCLTQPNMLPYNLSILV